MDLQCASQGGAQTSRLAEDGGDEVTSGIETSPESTDRIFQSSCDRSLQLSLTIKVGTRLGDIGQYGEQGGEGRKDERGDPGFDDLLCNFLETVLVRLVVPFVNRKVESIGTIDLDVYQARAVNVQQSISVPRRWRRCWGGE